VAYAADQGIDLFATTGTEGASIGSS
jgi:hypothetical protein